MTAERIDVLAVIDENIACMRARWENCCPSNASPDIEPPSLVKLRETRAAIAELIEVVKAVDANIDGFHLHVPLPFRLQQKIAAIARVQGGAK